VVHKFIDHENQEISRLSQYLLDAWNQLKSVYRIPKRAHVEMIPSNMIQAESDSIPVLNGQGLFEHDDVDDMIASDDDPVADEVEEDQDTSSVITSSSFPTTDTLAKKTQKPSSRSVSQTQGRRKKIKRIKYESSREFFDPDTDYFEYLTMDVTPEDIVFNMKYPPQNLIPTAPKAMLDTSHHYHQKHQYSNKHKKLIATPTSTTSTPAYFSYNATNNINHAISKSTPILISTNTTTLTNGTEVNTNTQSTQQLQPQQQFYTEYYQNPSLYDYSQYYYAQAAAVAEGKTIEEYYYALQQSYTETANHQWQVAVTGEGDTYYYNRITNQTQWEVPAELLELQQQQPPPPPPPPPVPPPPPASSSVEPSTSTSKGTGLSIEGVVDPLQLEGLVEQAIMDTEDRKRLRQQSIGDLSPTSKGSSHLLTPTSGSVDATSVNGDGPYLNDIDLKQEVGKVVTKYLSSKQQSLWKGDKHLFKDLARKVIVHRTLYSLHSYLLSSFLGDASYCRSRNAIRQKD
jgi:hypothetical protein